jgi:hypothetical protein
MVKQKAISKVFWNRACPAFENTSDVPISAVHQDGLKPHQPAHASARWFLQWRMWPTGNERGFLMTTRRQFLIGISTALLSSPAIVRAGSLMQVRGIVMPLHQNCYGWCDRLAINLRYHSGELRGATRSTLPSAIRLGDLRRNTLSWWDQDFGLQRHP